MTPDEHTAEYLRILDLVLDSTIIVINDGAESAADYLTDHALADFPGYLGITLGLLAEAVEAVATLTGSNPQAVTDRIRLDAREEVGL